jgi:hypothetical protein
MKEYEKNTAINKDFFTVQNIANSPDEVIEMFKETPIYNVLLQRREFCIKLSHRPIGEKEFNMLEMYNKNIKEFFFL